MPEAKPTPGFLMLMEASWKFMISNIGKYILMSIILFVPLFLIILASGLLTGIAGLSENLGVLAIFPAIIVIIVTLYQFVAGLALLRLTTTIDQSKPVQYGAIIKWAIYKVGSFIMLMIRIFIYTWAWLLILIMLAYSALNFALVVIDTGNPQLFSLISYALGAGGLVVLVISILRGVRTVFAQYALADQDCDSKTALAHSIKISTGNWWKIVLYSLGMMIFIGLLAGIVLIGFEMIHEVASGIANLLLNAIGGYFALAFFMGFMRMLEMMPKKK